LSFLKSLPTRHIKSGIGEVIKYGVICDRGLFEYLERNYAGILKLKPDDIERIIYKSVLIKSRIVEEDEKEKKGLRTILNFGHTIGHALEAATDYSGPYSHGEAVSFGMVCAADISERLGFWSSELKVRLESLLNVFGLPTAIKKVDINKLMKSIILDKKFIHGKTRFVLPVKIGEVKVVEDVPLRMIEGVIKERRRL
jgi:3-dehydroquinate synthase